MPSRWVGLVLAVLFVPFAVACEARRNEPAATDRPNILMLVADDLGFNDLGAYGNRDVRTPHLDALAASGTRFTRFYTAGDVCAPTRASLLTGLYPQRLGYRFPPRGIPEEIVTLPELLRDAGYKTHHVGKWHLGVAPRSVRPLAQGFDTFYGFLHSRRLNYFGKGSYRDPLLVSGDRKPRVRQGHLTDLLTEHAIELIRGERNRSPWFLNLWYFAPHAPVQPPERWAARHPDDPAGRYRALVSALDENVGRVLAALDETHQASRTIVVFLSDNGGLEAESNLPFTGAKTRLFEGAVRVPMILRVPGRETEPIVDQALISMDVLPTLVSLAGVDLEHAVDGSDLTPLLSGERIPARAFFWESTGYSLPGSPARSRPRPVAPDVTLEPHGTTFSVLSADGRWRLSVDPDVALVDLAADPSGRVNLWREHPEVVEALTADFRRWAEEMRGIPVRAEARGDARWSGSRATFPGEGRVDLMGYDVARSPGVGTWTFAVGVHSERDPSGPEVLAAQEGVWSLEREPGGQLIARMGTARLTATTPVTGPCTGIVLTARGESAKRPGSVRLVVNGRVVAEDEFSLSAGEAVLREPTTLGNTRDGGRPFSGALHDPTLLNVALSPNAARELSIDLCTPAGD